MQQHPLLPIAMLVLSVVACGGARVPDALSTSETRARSPYQLEGTYAICDGAYAHVESLVLRDGTFQHFIQTHGINGGRSSGSFTVVGDTVEINVTETGPLPAVAQRQLPLRYNFVAGEYAGYRVLWRGTDQAIRAAAGEMSEYAALFYAGSDPMQRQVPSCNELRRRVRGTSF